MAKFASTHSLRTELEHARTTLAEAEKERIARVAEDLGAHYSGPDGCNHRTSFADYLRGQSATATTGAQT